jgi:hypothetical protein
MNTEPDALDPEALESKPKGELDALESELTVGRFQFGLGALFSLTVACAVYFALERATEGHFALFVLGGTALALGLALPILWALIGVLKLLSEAKEPLRTLLLMAAIAGVVWLSLRSFPGF